MLRRIFPILLILAVFLTACSGTAATPTMNPADVQNTAVAAAWTMVAATNAAIPTATSLPPTDVPSPTPLPTFTPEPLLIPTLEFPPTPTLAPTTSSGGGGSCTGPINIGEAGFLHRIRVENNTKAPITVSLNLWTKNLFGQCGIIAVSLTKNQSTVVNIPSGSWWAGAYVNGPKPSQPTGVSFIIGASKTDDLLRLIVSTQSIKYVGP